MINESGSKRLLGSRNDPALDPDFPVSAYSCRFQLCFHAFLKSFLSFFYLRPAVRSFLLVNVTESDLQWWRGKVAVDHVELPSWKGHAGAWHHFNNTPLAPASSFSPVHLVQNVRFFLLLNMFVVSLIKKNQQFAGFLLICAANVRFFLLMFFNLIF